VLVPGERHHVRFVARAWRRSLPRSGRGCCDDEGRCYRRASHVRREGARTSGTRGGNCGISRSVDRPRGHSILAGARGRGGKPLYSGDAAGPAPIEDAEALGVGRGCPISDGRQCRTLRAEDPGNQACADQVGRPHSDGKRSQNGSRSSGRVFLLPNADGGYR